MHHPTAQATPSLHSSLYPDLFSDTMSDARMASVKVQFEWPGEPDVASVGVCGDFTQGQLVSLHREEGQGVWRLALQVGLL